MLACCSPQRKDAYRTTVPCAVCNVLICTCTCVPPSRRDEPYAPQAGLPWSHCWRSGSFCLLMGVMAARGGCRIACRLPCRSCFAYTRQHSCSSPTSWASCDTMMCKKRARARDLGTAAAALESSSASLLDAWETSHVVMFISTTSGRVCFFISHRQLLACLLVS
jgi:hypothetical protein